MATGLPAIRQGHLHITTTISTPQKIQRGIRLVPQALTYSSQPAKYD
jgi:hypothetical protein